MIQQYNAIRSAYFLLTIGQLQLSAVKQIHWQCVYAIANGNHIMAQPYIFYANKKKKKN